jgi:hypothetical protein
MDVMSSISIAWIGGTPNPRSSIHLIASLRGKHPRRSIFLLHLRVRRVIFVFLDPHAETTPHSYPVIQELEVGMLTSNFSEKASTGLKEMTEKLCQGEKPYCAEILFKIISTMAMGASAKK